MPRFGPINIEIKPINLEEELTGNNLRRIKTKKSNKPSKI